MPLRTSTSSPVMRNVWKRHDSQKPPSSSSSTPAPRAAREDEVVADDVVDGVGLVAFQVGDGREEPADDAVAQVGDDDAEHDDEEQPAAQHGGERVQSMPLAVAERRAHVGDGGGIGHRPVRRVSATAIRVSRSARRRAARARDHDAGGRRGGHELELGDAEDAVEGPVGDVDELHAAVGNRDHPLPEDAAAEHEVVLAQLVAVGAGLAREDHERPHRHDVTTPPESTPTEPQQERTDERRGEDEREEGDRRDQPHPDVVARELVPGAVAERQPFALRGSRIGARERRGVGVSERSR
jgi:hypothetical protein